MDIESLRLFLDVWKSGNITSAANNHFITQSALSRRLTLLEKELGIQLFHYIGCAQQRAWSSVGESPTL